MAVTAAALLTGAPTHPAAAAVPTGFVTVMNAASGGCLDAEGVGTANGTVVQQYACDGTTAQQWSLTGTGEGHVRIGDRNDTAQAAGTVTGHQAYGLGSYCCFDVDPAVTPRTGAVAAVRAPANARRRTRSRRGRRTGPRCPGAVPRAVTVPRACAAPTAEQTHRGPGRTARTELAAPADDGKRSGGR
ncbi:RICIN domain-containing protein [Streptomyces sp. NPDC090108]|uniref:RICIN domain-containing protein n=1 Tax=Streptomyces sp. NPDC090108 TaxID=3365947 RepID=UPI00381965C1